MRQEGKTALVNNNEMSDKDADEFTMYRVSLCATDEKCVNKVSIIAEGQPTSMLLETGTAVTLTLGRMYNDCFTRETCKPTKAAIRTYSGVGFKLEGWVVVNMERNR